MKYFFQSMLGAMLLLSGVFAFSSCGNDESDPDSTVTIAIYGYRRKTTSV